MKKKLYLLTGLVVLGTGVVLMRRRMPRLTSALGVMTTEGIGRWHVVTINRAMEDAFPDGRLPGPLAEIADAIVVETRPAPRNRGTEVAARLRDPIPESVGGAAAEMRSSPRRAVRRLRRALRDSKTLLETGEILRPDRPPTNRPSLTGLPLDAAIRRAREEGRL